MILLSEYFGAKLLHPEATPEMQDNAESLLQKVNGLVAEAVAAGVFDEELDPDTGTTISGSRGGYGDGGFRLSTSTTGGPKSAHRKAHAVDKYDPKDQLDAWLTGFDRENGATNAKLEQHGLYREHPADTPGWCHLQDTPPGSGKRTFRP